MLAHLRATPRCTNCLSTFYPSVRYLSDVEGPKKRQQKAKKKAKSKGSEPETGRSKDLDLILASLDAPVRQEPPVDEVEQARRYTVGRNYVIGRFRRHNEIDHDLTCKIYLKNHALSMLPKNSKLKEEALKIDDSGPPAWRHLPVWTPPIPGFDPSQYVEREEE